MYSYYTVAQIQPTFLYYKYYLFVVIILKHVHGPRVLCLVIPLLRKRRYVDGSEKVKFSSPKKLSADCHPTVGQQSADSWPTVC